MNNDQNEDELMQSDQESRDGSSYFLRPEHPEDNETLAHLNENIPVAAAFFENSLVRVIGAMGPYQFYVWPLNEAEYNSNFLYEMNDYYSSPANQNDNDHGSGDEMTIHVVAYGGQYYRARILIRQYRLYTVYLVDFGITAIVEECFIFTCEPQFALVPDMAYPCSLEDGMSPSTGSIFDEILFRAIVLGNVFEAQLLYVDTFEWTRIIVKLWRVQRIGYEFIRIANDLEVQDQRIPIRALLLDVQNVIRLRYPNLLS
ncbi:hypothetical protein ACOME3_006450 [Neoechinorhynchus agilis]